MYDEKALRKAYAGARAKNQNGGRAMWEQFMSTNKAAKRSSNGTGWQSKERGGRPDNIKEYTALLNKLDSERPSTHLKAAPKPKPKPQPKNVISNSKIGNDTSINKSTIKINNRSDAKDRAQERKKTISNKIEQNVGNKGDFTTTIGDSNTITNSQIGNDRSESQARIEVAARQEQKAAALQKQKAAEKLEMDNYVLGLGEDYRARSSTDIFNKATQNTGNKGDWTTNLGNENSINNSSIGNDYSVNIGGIGIGEGGGSSSSFNNMQGLASYQALNNNQHQRSKSEVNGSNRPKLQFSDRAANLYNSLGYSQNYWSKKSDAQQNFYLGDIFKMKAPEYKGGGVNPSDPMKGDRTKEIYDDFKSSIRS